MDALEQYFYDNRITEERILQEVDEWTLYHYYLTEILGIQELELRTTYSSPIREKDSNPSFSIYENTRSKKEVEYLWKDSALGISGDIFDLLCRMFTISEKEVLNMINHDFCILDDSKEVKVKRIVKRPESKPETRIRIKSKKFTKEAWDFWNSYYVSKEDLIFNKVQLVDYVWFSGSQEFPFKVKDLMFAYPEFNWETNRWHYQLYSPYSKEFKFRNDLAENQIFSWNNLIFDNSSNLVITKSKKDIICLNSFGVQAVSCRSETTRIKPKTIQLLKESYKNVLVLYDNDEAGIKGASEYNLEYNLESIFIPKDSGCKDFSDFLKKFGRKESKKLLEELNIC